MKMQENQAKCDATETAASAILSILEKTAGKAEKTACFVEEKTSSVTQQEPPQLSPNKQCAETQRQYPPLFSRIKELVDQISVSLNRIEDTMRRCEL
jgi:hypothetical protein